MATYIVSVVENGVVREVHRFGQDADIMLMQEWHDDCLIVHKNVTTEMYLTGRLVRMQEHTLDADGTFHSVELRGVDPSMQLHSHGDWEPM